MPYENRKIFPKNMNKLRIKRERKVMLHIFAKFGKKKGKFRLYNVDKRLKISVKFNGLKNNRVDFAENRRGSQMRTNNGLLKMSLILEQAFGV